MDSLVFWPQQLESKLPVVRTATDIRDAWKNRRGSTHDLAEVENTEYGSAVRSPIPRASQRDRGLTGVWRVVCTAILRWCRSGSGSASSCARTSTRPCASSSRQALVSCHGSAPSACSCWLEVLAHWLCVCARVDSTEPALRPPFSTTARPSNRYQTGLPACIPATMVIHVFRRVAFVAAGCGCQIRRLPRQDEHHQQEGTPSPRSLSESDPLLCCRCCLVCLCVSAVRASAPRRPRCSLLQAGYALSFASFDLSLDHDHFCGSSDCSPICARLCLQTSSFLFWRSPRARTIRSTVPPTSQSSGCVTCTIRL